MLRVFPIVRVFHTKIPFAYLFWVAVRHKPGFSIKPKGTKITCHSLINLINNACWLGFTNKSLLWLDTRWRGLNFTQTGLLYETETTRLKIRGSRLNHNVRTLSLSPNVIPIHFTSMAGGTCRVAQNVAATTVAAHDRPRNRLSATALSVRVMYEYCELSWFTQMPVHFLSWEDGTVRPTRKFW